MDVTDNSSVSRKLVRTGTFSYFFLKWDNDNTYHKWFLKKIIVMISSIEGMSEITLSVYTIWRFNIGNGLQTFQKG